ncbi:hypothetical protein AAC387_Pa07g1985 [Persea americana]
MKREIAAFVSQCLTCQQIKAEHSRVVAAIGDSGVEMGAYHHGFRLRFAYYQKGEQCHLGYYRSSHEVCSLHSYADKKQDAHGTARGFIRE